MYGAILGASSGLMNFWGTAVGSMDLPSFLVSSPKHVKIEGEMVFERECDRCDADCYHAVGFMIHKMRRRGELSGGGFPILGFDLNHLPTSQERVVWTG